MALLGSKRAKKPPPAPADSSDESSDAAEANEGNTGWANSILKVLQTTKPETQNKTVLSRAKKLKAANAQNNKAKKDYDFEIEGVKQEDEEAGEKKEEKPQASALDAQLTGQQRRNVPLQLRVKPSFRDMERERSLRKVATRGTVQFFNAVRIQQKDLKQQLEEAGPLDSRQDAVLNNIDKRKFLDVLMSGKRAKSAVIDNAVKKEEPATDSDSAGDDEDEDEPSHKKKKSEWNVLREDFMTNKKIKHWDEEDEDDGDQQAEDEATNSDESENE